jgi:hypothetical protein
VVQGEHPSGILFSDLCVAPVHRTVVPLDDEPTRRTSQRTQLVRTHRIEPIDVRATSESRPGDVRG